MLVRIQVYSENEIGEHIAFVEKKTHPSSTLPISEGADGFFRWHSQRWYERLPLYLQEESKRIRAAWSRVIEEMVGGQHRVDEDRRAGHVRVKQRNRSDRDIRGFVRRRTGVLEWSDKQRKKLLQWGGVVRDAR